jgi:membrane carboxypeptidase/penicillin-binding protein
MLESVVEGGTGRRASIAGYRIAGKTGTAQISEIGGYSPDRYIASFAGFAPSRAPRLVGVVTIFEPRGQYHGGEVAAPVFGAIMRQVLPLLGVPPAASSSPPIANAGSRLADARDKRAPAGMIDRARQQAAAGTIPDFRGLTARQALALGAELGLEVRLRGSGFVAEQRPGAGSPVEALAGLLELELMVGQAG